MNKKLQKIKEENNLLSKPSKKQKRFIEIKEFEDGTYSMKGFAWDIDLEKKEIKEAVDYWVSGKLEKGIKN